jgi:uncharacterized protein
MKDRLPDPRALDIAGLCRAGARVEGSTSLVDLPRLAASVLSGADGALRVRWSAQGSTLAVHGAAPQLWLTLRAELPVQLECQRCLQPLAWPLALDRRLRFVSGEQEAARLDEELEEDVLELQPRLDLIGLIEDELILALPLVPRHESCPEPLPLPAAEPEPLGEAAASPFAALARLRRPPS